MRTRVLGCPKVPMREATLFAAFAFTFTYSFALYGGAVGHSAHAPCPRNSPQSFDPGRVTVIEEGELPSHLVFRPTGIRLRAVPDGSRPDPGTMVVRDSQGRLYTANAPGWEAVISVWDPHGEYVTSFGRPGEGPGELSGRLNIFLDGQDRLHVRDNSLSWSVFSSGHEFLWRVSANAMQGLVRTTAILDNGMALTSNDGYADRTRYFHLVDSTGALYRTFAPVGDEVSGAGVSLWRTLAYGGGDTFWAGPVLGDPRGYLLEEWGLDGTLRRAFRREASWFDPRDEENRVAVEYLHIDESGLLYVVVIRATEGFAEAMKKARRLGQRLTREERSALTEAVVEIIDTRSGELLASEVYPVSEARELVPTQLFRGIKQGAVYREGRDGIPSVTIVSVDLEAR